MQHWEDFHVGDRLQLGHHTFTAEEILAFARQFDPQPFHLDPAAGAATHFGGLVASGWHTASACMRLYVDGLLNDSSSLGSPGLEELRWLAPVRPGDTLTATVEVVETRESSRDPNRGTVVALLVGVNQDGTEVIRWLGRGLFGRRPPAG